MLQTEFIRNLQSNYERILLRQKPDERKYQYCILTRGGIKGLLPCSLRYINGQAYLYYDITSRQNVAQLYGKQVIDREWVRDFFWSYSMIRQELGRFLLDEKNLLFDPEQIFQDLGSHSFFFLYLPYCEEESGFAKLFDFLIERLDYEDDRLVSCIYKIYEQYEKNGDVYLERQLLEDVMMLEEDAVISEDGGSREESWTDEVEEAERASYQTVGSVPGERSVRTDGPERTDRADKAEKKGILSFLGNKKKRDAEYRREYYDTMSEIMEGRAVAEDSAYGEEKYGEEEYGRTVYMETEQEEVIHKLYTPDGRLAAKLEKEVFTIGKNREEVDLVLEDDSVSRLHARIFAENQVLYLEDLNSTNGTFKNGLRMQPYEKRRLEEGDEIRFGKVLFVYR